MVELWNATRDELRRQLGSDLFTTHFASFVALSLDGDTMTVGTPDEMAALVVDKNYRDLVERCALQATGVALRVRVEECAPQVTEGDEVQSDVTDEAPVDDAQLSLFDLEGEANAPDTVVEAGVIEPARAARRASAPRMPPMSERPAPLSTREVAEAGARCGLSPKFQLDAFVVGTSNEFAYEAATAVVDKPGQLYNPLFLYGGVGLGKTHLMNAIGMGVLQANPAARVRCISAETFVNELIESIGARRMDEFRQKNRVDVDVLLIDDIQFIAGKERTQEEFFHTFNALYQAGGQIVLTSDRIPQEMPELEERLMSRLTMGLIADIQPPDLETRVAILRAKARELGFEVPTAVFEYIAHQIRANVRELHGALLRIGSYARLRREPISLSLAQAQLDRVHRDRSGAVTAELILKITADVYGVSVREIKGRKRAATVSVPRKVAMYLARAHTDASFPELGVVFGGRDHTTIMSAVRGVERLVADGDPIRQRIEAIERRLV